jgi:hypothetical protein
VSSISGSRVFYAGGGGAGTDNGGSSGTTLGFNGGQGGGGGGGIGGIYSFRIRTTGEANTGGGGGGASLAANTGGAGGSGIVIIRYPSYLAPATATTGSPETYIAGQYRVYKFVASGTITF